MGYARVFSRKTRVFLTRNGVKTPYSVENLVDRVTIYQILYYMDSLGLLSCGLFSGMTIVVAGYVSNTHPLSGAGSLAVLLSCGGHSLYTGIAVITPGNTAIYAPVRFKDGTSSSDVSALVTFSGDKLTSNAGLSINAMILA